MASLRPTPPLALLPLAFAILCFLCTRGTAQGTDQLLSRRYVSSIVPDDLKIESAARIGDVVLAVWGSTVRDSGGAIVGVLSMQMVRNGSPVGAVGTITSNEARPSGFVEVIPAGDRFIVIWNDQRGDDSTAFFRQVDKEGATGSETIFTSRWISPAGVAYTPTPQGWRLLWSHPSDSAIYARDLDRNGAFSGGARVFAQGLLAAFSSPSARLDYTLLDRAGLAPLLLDSNGNEIELGPRAERFSHPHHLSPDGTLATLSNDTLQVFRTLLDSTPERTVPIPLLHAAIAEAACIGRDSADRYVVHFAIGGKSAGGPWDEIDLSLLRVTETSPGIVSNPSRIAITVLAVPGGPCRHITGDITSVRMYHGAANACRMRIVFEGIDVTGCGGLDSVKPYRTEREFAFDGSGDTGNTRFDVARPITTIPVERVRNKLASTISVTIDTTRILLSADAVVVPDPVPHLFPGITSVDGRLIVGWLAVPGDTVAEIGSWNPAGTGTVGMGPELDIDRLETAPDLPGRRAMQRQFIPLAGHFVLSSLLSWTNEEEGIGVVGQRCLFTVHQPTINGWREVLRVDTSDINLSVMPFAYAHDFDDREVLGAWGLADARIGTSHLRVLAFDHDGNSTWRSDSLDFDPSRTMALVPIGRNDYAFVDPYVFVHITDDKVDRYREHRYPYGSYAHLLTPYVLNLLPAGAYMDLKLFDFHGTRLSETSYMRRLTMTDRPFALQNPVDSLITLLWGGSGGVRMATFDLKLRHFQDHMVINDGIDSSANPSALFRGDTLFVVWESYRNGIPAIHGKAIPRMLRSRVEEPMAETGGRPEVSIVPNPARSSVTVRLSSGVEGEGLIEVFDNLGVLRVRESIPDGVRVVDLNTAALPSGGYVLLVHGNGIISSLPLTIIH